MNKCAVDGCPETAMQGSALCFLHWFDVHGGLMPDLETIPHPAPVQSPIEIHDRLMRELRMERYQADSQEAEGESAS